MAFFAGLVFFYLIVWLLSLLMPVDPISSVTGRAIISAAIMFFGVGLSHFIKKEKLLKMMEGWRYAIQLNYISGAAEIAGAIGLLIPATRIYAAWGLIFLLICVFPANIYLAHKKPGFYNISRLFFQPLYIAWIWWCCGLQL